jgi:N-acetylmuramoyl-L-alanine amidase
MKAPLLILTLILSILGADSLSLVGLSGKSHSLKLYKVDGDFRVDPNDFYSALNFKIDRNSSQFTTWFNSEKLYIKSNSTKAVVGDTTFSITKSGATKQAITIPDLVKLSERVTGLFFIIDSLTIRVSKTPKLEKLEISRIVVIDPGHGGKDPGAVGQDSAFEKDVVLQISLYAKEFIEKKSTVTVLLTRGDDTFIPLRDRTAFANDNKADLFISVHANSSPKLDKVDGYKMYFLSDAKNETDEHLAQFENSVMELEEESELDFLSSILVDMANSEFLHQSQELSITFAEGFGDNIGEMDKLHTGVGQANFFVLRGATMPAVLVETGFISNRREEKLLASDKFQKKMGEAMANAILSNLKTGEKER